MRVLGMAMGILVLTQGACYGHAQQSQQAMPTGQLVREVVYNELHDHQGHGYWRYWIERRMQKETRLMDQVETAEGLVSRLSLSNGRPVSAEGQQEEQARLDHLLSSPGEKARHRREYAEDEKQIGRIVALLPDAFLFEYAGEENGCHRLRFRPPVQPASFLAKGSWGECCARWRSPPVGGSWGRADAPPEVDAA